jgi:hypothetical protein
MCEKFGYGTSEEMCFDFLYYYPKIYGLEICTSIAPQNVLNDFYRSLMRYWVKKLISGLSNKISFNFRLKREFIATSGFERFGKLSL